MLSRLFSPAPLCLLMITLGFNSLITAPASAQQTEQGAKEPGKNYKQATLEIKLKAVFAKEPRDGKPTYLVDAIAINGIFYDSGATLIEDYDFKELKVLLKEQLGQDSRPADWDSADLKVPAPLVLILDPNLNHAQFKLLLKHFIKLSPVMDLRLIGAKEDDLVRMDFGSGPKIEAHKIAPDKRPDLPKVPNITRKVRSPTLKKGNPLSDPSDTDSSPQTPSKKPDQDAKVETPGLEPVPPNPPVKDKSSDTPSTQPNTTIITKPATTVKKAPPRRKTFILIYDEATTKPAYGIQQRGQYADQQALLKEMDAMLKRHWLLTVDSPLILKVEDTVKMKQLMPLLKGIQAIGYEVLRLSYSEPPA